jgi:copper chaperone NosL
MTRRACVLLASVAVILATLLSGCGDSEASLDPPEIHYGEDISEMGMFVVDPRYTVAALPGDSDKWLLFDDIGEFFKYLDLHPDTEFRAMWVNDYRDKDWLKAEDAWYVESSKIKSPMGWGIAAFRDEADARATAEDAGGTVMTWQETREREWAEPPGPIDMASPAASPVASPTADHAGH